MTLNLAMAACSLDKMPKHVCMNSVSGHCSKFLFLAAERAGGMLSGLSAQDHVSKCFRTAYLFAR